jgi:hypothetical protein
LTSRLIRNSAIDVFFDGDDDEALVIVDALDIAAVVA